VNSKVFANVRASAYN